MKFGTLEFSWRTLPTRAKGLVVVTSVCGLIALCCWIGMQWVDSDALHQPTIADDHFRHPVMTKGRVHFITDQQWQVLQVATPILCLIGALLVCSWFLLRPFARPDFPTADRKDGKSRWTH
jgi:hypothetical protein